MILHKLNLNIPIEKLHLNNIKANVLCFFIQNWTNIFYSRNLMKLDRLINEDNQQCAREAIYILGVALLLLREERDK